MDNIIETLEHPESGSIGAASNPDPVTSTIQLTSSDLNPNMEDVMKVIKDLDGDFNDSTGPAESHTIPEVPNLNAGESEMIPNPPQVLDKTAVANSRFLELAAEQVRIEGRYERLTRRLNLLRCRHLGNFVSQEISRVHEYCKQVTPKPSLSLPKINPYNINIIHPPANVPEGIVLPSVPSKEVLMSPPSSFSSSTATSSETKKIITENIKTEFEDKTVPSLPSEEVKQKCDEALGQLGAHLKHFIQSYDSEATESSSGGESCDEMDNFPAENSHYVPIKKRAKYVWQSERAKVASKWTWLSAQISDLEYRIRQQTEFYRQIRAAKGAVTVGEPVVSWPPHAKKPVQAVVRPDRDVPLNCKPVTKDYSRVEINGKKIIFKESIPSGNDGTLESDGDDSTLACCRTKPIKMVRRRRIISTKELYKTVSRAAKESSVSCDCMRPSMWCSICFGRTYHSQIPDPIIHERNQCIALLDHSYHQVLSSKADIQLQHQMLEKIDDRTWLSAPFAIKGPEIKDASLEKKEKKLKKSSKSEEEDGSDALKKKKINKKRDKDGKLKKFKKTEMKRRKSLNVHHYSDDRGTAMHDLSSDGDTISGVDGNSPVASPSVPGSNQAWLDHFRKKRETAYDIDNIVIPYSIASASRVEKLQYKEILTPTWRQVTDQPFHTAEKELDEDISESVYESRHSKAEVEEQKRWQTPLYKTSGGQRSRNRRQDSCRTEASSGCNTPDPLSPGMVEKVDTLEVNTRPSTPISAGDDYNSMSLQAASIRNRRRTSSATKSRDRNPSEDNQSSRCASPTPEEQQQLHDNIIERLPYESRTFPLTDEEYAIMVEESANFFDSKEPVPQSTEQKPNSGEVNDQDIQSKLVGNDANNASPNRRGEDPPFSSSSTADEDEDTEDPDWNGEMEDPEDPEWNENFVESTSSTAATLKNSNSSSKSGSRKNPGLSLHIPKT